MRDSRSAATRVLALPRAMGGTRGKSIEPPPEVQAAMDAQKERAGRMTALRGQGAPDWVLHLAEQRADVAAVVDATIARALERRDDATLQEVKAVLNELGRDPAGAAAVTRAITLDGLDLIRR